MTVTMPFDPTKRKIIQDYMKQEEEDAGDKDKLRQDKFEVKGKVDLAPIYQFNHTELAFNKANGRIHAEAIEKEAELGRSLDIWNKDDQKIVKGLLLSIRKEENEKIKTDLAKKGQIRPGIITCDGIVINGNRRKALLDEIYEETGEEKYKYLEAHVLPSNITKSELWLIEAGIQMSAPQQLDYSPINNLLKLKEGVSSGLRIEDMASRIFGVTAEKIRTDLKRLELIDEYLNEFLDKPGKYYLVKGLAEHFIDLQNILEWTENPRVLNRIDWGPEENDINELKLVAFYYIRAGYPHLRVRDLRKIFTMKKPWENVRQAIALKPNLEVTELKQAGLGLESDTDEVDDEYYDEREDDDGTQTLIEKRDKQEEVVWKSVRKKKLKAFFEEAKEQQNIIEYTAKPIALLKRAYNNLKAIPTDSKLLTDPDMDGICRDIISTTNSIRKIIQKNLS